MISQSYINEVTEYNNDMENCPPMEYTCESINELKDHLEISGNKNIYSDHSMTAIRNLLDLCGKEYTLEKVKDYAHENEIIEYIGGDDWVGRHDRGTFALDRPEQLKSMIEGLGNIEVQAVKIEKQEDLQHVLDKVNHGHRAIMQVGGGFIHDNEKPKRSIGGMLSQPILGLLNKEEKSGGYIADTAVTLLKSDRPGYVYISDPYYADEKCVEISTDKLLESAEKTGGEVIITKESFPLHSVELGFNKNRVFCNGYEVPPSHLERLKTDELKEFSPENAMEKVGAQVYDSLLKPFAGYLRQFSDLSGSCDCNTFSRKYAQYILHPSELKSENMPLYDFLKEKIFAGREFVMP